MIQYLETAEGICTEQLSGGYFEGWPQKPSSATHLKLLMNSDFVVLAVNKENQVIGFITAISDGVLSAYIPFLEVLPTYRNLGIGKELTRRMLEKLRSHYMVDLMCDEELQPYYRSFGMEASTGMIVRNRASQSGVPEMDF